MSEIDTKYVDEALRLQEEGAKSQFGQNWVRLRLALRRLSCWLRAYFRADCSVAKPILPPWITETRSFCKVKTAASSLQLDADVTTRELTQEETQALFPSCPLRSCRVRKRQRLIGLEGRSGIPNGDIHGGYLIA